jgi:hypothetical protein
MTVTFIHKQFKSRITVEIYPFEHFYLDRIGLLIRVFIKLTATRTF